MEKLVFCCLAGLNIPEMINQLMSTLHTKTPLSAIAYEFVYFIAF